jgi:hypothetical protein
MGDLLRCTRPEETPGKIAALETIIQSFQWYANYAIKTVAKLREFTLASQEIARR